ncbi:MAG: SWIM zinc finger family protein [Paracoccus sp. (in: a-proteobacteria)]
MSIYEFEVQGSAPEPYQVRIERRDNQMFAYCTCPAGKNGTACKHRFAIFDGDASTVISDNKSEVSQIPTLIPGSNLESALGEVEEAQRAFDAAKKKLSACKKKLARLMNG